MDKRMTNSATHISLLHEYLVAQDILPTNTNLEMGANSFSHYNNETNTIYVDFAEFAYGESRMEIYLHEAGHAFHFAQDPDDWEDKQEDLEVGYRWGEQMFAHDDVKMREWYEGLPLEYEAHQLKAILWRQVQEDWEQIFPSQKPMGKKVWNFLCGKKGR